jgi:hypothetical protein
MGGRVALIEADEVRRLFRGLVNVLHEQDPDRVHAAFQVAELYQQILPYRAYRARLGFDTNQDYEGAVLGLLAGVGGYATVEPPEAQEALAAEASARNPDPGLFREFAGARVRLNPMRIREVLGQSSTYAPPEVSPPPPPPLAPPPQGERPQVFELEGRAAVLEPARESSEAGRCRACRQPLPVDRAVVFCPWCGIAVGTPTCHRCGDELEPSWKFCPRCGDPSR